MISAPSISARTTVLQRQLRGLNYWNAAATVLEKIVCASNPRQMKVTSKNVWTLLICFVKVIVQDLGSRVWGLLNFRRSKVWLKKTCYGRYLQDVINIFQGQPAKSDTQVAIPKFWGMKAKDETTIFYSIQYLQYNSKFPRSAFPVPVSSSAYHYEQVTWSKVHQRLEKK